MKLWAAGAAVVALLGVLLLAPVLAVAGVGLPAGGPSPEVAAQLGIPRVILQAYITAAARSPEVAEGCRVRWSILAGIGKVESGHGAHWGPQSVVHPDGLVTPPIVGPRLDGSGGTAAIPDSDDGRWDGDTIWDRAVGPLQFIPGSWRLFGQEASGDGVADPHNVIDSALAAVAHLCLATPGDYTVIADLRRALFGYNRSHDYVETVLGWILTYDAAGPSPAVAAGGAGGYALPVAPELLSLERIRRPHHDYPAWDFGIPTGTPIFAVRGGVVAALGAGRCGQGVVIDGDDGHRYSYCHASAVHVDPRDPVGTGQQIMASGNTGNSTGPHLHLGIRVAGQSVCPQPLLEAWYAGRPMSPSEAPPGGCSY